MSDAHDEHASMIKTPRQLLMVVLAGFLIPIITIILVARLVIDARGLGHDDPGMRPEAIAKRLQPVSKVAVKEAGVPGAQQTGEQVVQTACAACHASGALNAPKIGDKAAWAPRIAIGLDKLVSNAINGIRQMPPRGGNPSLTDTEVARAVVVMANQSGASFSEPAPTAAVDTSAGTPAAPAAGSAPKDVAAIIPTPAAPATAPAADAAPAAGAAPATKAAQGDGKAVFDMACAVCHASGVAGAPKAGDKAAWAPRIQAGMESLYNSALKGKNAMPPKGGNAALADADVKAAVDYMASLVK